MGTRRDIDLRAAALAAAQHGVISRAQLLDLGVGARAIGSRLRAGRLVRLQRGVYALGHAELRPEGFAMAAALAVGPAAVLSHRSAAAVWGLRPAGGVLHELSVPSDGGRRDRRRDGLRVHRRPGLHADEVTVERGLPVTTVARTQLDLAAILRPHELRRAVEAAERLELFDLVALERLLARHPGEPGTPALRRLLAEYRTHDLALTRSDLEALMLELCADHTLPRPQVNRYDGAREIDFRWPAARLVVETDGWGTHRTRRAFEADRERDRRLAVEGWRVVRITYRQLMDEPAAVAADLRAARRVTGRWRVVTPHGTRRAIGSEAYAFLK